MPAFSKEYNLWLCACHRDAEIMGFTCANLSESKVIKKLASPPFLMAIKIVRKAPSAAI